VDLLKMKKTHLHDEGPVGELHPPDTAFLRIAAGEARDPETGDILYELTISPDSAPIIRHVPSGRWWTCAWRRLIALAEAEGLNAEHEAPVVSLESDG
jgi:hypothetical protein